MKFMVFFNIYICHRCLPMNFRGEDLASGVLRERVKVGASLADVDPMTLDKSVCFFSLFRTDLSVLKGKSLSGFVKFSLKRIKCLWLLCLHQIESKPLWIIFLLLKF